MPLRPLVIAAALFVTSSSLAAECPPLSGTSDGLLSEGRRRYEAGKIAPALCAFEQAARASTNAEAWFWVAAARHELGRDGAAEAAVERALELDPAHVDAWLLSGVIAQLRGAYEDARARYLRYLEAEPRGDHAADVRQVLAQLPAP